MKNAVTGGLAAVCLMAVGISAGAQIHNGPVVVSHPVMTSSAPPRPHPVIKAPRRGDWRAHRFHDCMRRYGDRKGCAYLAWHKHGGHVGPDLRR